MNQFAVKGEEKAFQARGEAFGTVKESNKTGIGGRGRGFVQGSALSWGKGNSIEPRQHSGERRAYRSGVQCHNCRKFSHICRHADFSRI